MFIRCKRLALVAAFVVVLLLGGGVVRGNLLQAPALLPTAPVLADTCIGSQGPC